MFEGATLNLLINAGIAGVFAVFAIVLVREFMKFLSEVMLTMIKTNTEIARQLTGLSQVIEEMHADLRARGTCPYLAPPKIIVPRGDD